MVLNKLYAVNDLELNYECGFVVAGSIIPPISINEGFTAKDIRQLKSGNVYGVFAWFGNSRYEANQVAHLNFIVFTNNLRTLNVPTGNTYGFDVSGGYVKNVFGVDTVYCMIINAPNVNIEDFPLGGRGNYTNQELSFEREPFVKKYNNTPDSITYTDNGIITAEPDEQGYYFPLFVDNFMSTEFGNDFSKLIPYKETATNRFAKYGSGANAFAVFFNEVDDNFKVSDDITSTVSGEAFILKFIENIYNNELTSYFPLSSD